jgi:uncharacterized protein YndB with AHSA1/START domain
VIDIIAELNAIQRTTGRRDVPAGQARTVVLRRSYDASVEDVWDAITNPERISRWFLPVSGDLRLGGKYQLEGNAGGEVLRCEAPRLLAVSWIMGEPKDGDFSEVEVRLSPGDGGRTDLELEHAAVVDPQFWDQFGPGAVGVGWDGALLGLGLHLRGGSIDDPAAWEKSAEARSFMTASSDAWGAALLAAGGDADEVKTMVANTTAFYVPEPTAEEGPANPAPADS